MSDQGRGEAANSVITEMLRPLVQEAKDLRATVQADGAARRKENRRLFALVIVLALMVAGLSTLGVQNRRLNGQNAELIRRVDAGNAKIVDCTTVGGDCYDEGRERTSAVAEQLLRANIIVAICARGGGTEAEVRACVEARLVQPSEQTEPGPVPAPTEQPAPPAPSTAP